jgi:hypothetical protein
VITPDYATRLIKLVRETLTTLEKTPEALDQELLVEPAAGGRPEVALHEWRGVYLLFRRNEAAFKRVVLALGYPHLDRPIERALQALAYNAHTRGIMKGVGGAPLRGLLIELDLLFGYKLLNETRPTDYPNHITIGRHGLMVERNFYTALHLPYRALEAGWDAIDLLSECCLTAGLPADAWLDPATQVYTFEVEAFRELKPGGRVVRLTGWESHHK